jgi:hypothetical protein
MLSVIFSKQGKRLGDIVAGTIVVREALVRQLAPAESKAPAESAPALETLLTEDEYVVLERFIDRRGALDQERRSALAAQLASRLANALPANEPSLSGGSSDLARLVRLYESERAARAQGAAARQQCEPSAKMAFASSSPSIATSPLTSRDCARQPKDAIRPSCSI